MFSHLAEVKAMMINPFQCPPPANHIQEQYCSFQYLALIHPIHQGLGWGHYTSNNSVSIKTNSQRFIDAPIRIVKMTMNNVKNNTTNRGGNREKKNKETTRYEEQLLLQSFAPFSLKSRVSFCLQQQ